MFEYEVRDISDVPLRTNTGRSFGLAHVFRNIPEGKALFFPCDDRQLKTFRSLISSTANHVHCGLSTRLDIGYNGVWVFHRNGDAS
jgi:hypothetical protein